MEKIEEIFENAANKVTETFHGLMFYLFGGIQIFVLTGTRKIIPVTLYPIDTVESIKNYIYLTEGIQPSAQLLLYNGMQLQNQEKIEDYQLQNGSTVLLILKMWA